MVIRFGDIYGKDVINSDTGSFIGTVEDLEFDRETAQILALVVRAKPGFFGLFGRGNETIIELRDIGVIGEDAVLVRFSRLENRSYY